MSDPNLLDQNATVARRVEALGLLTILFIGLKLGGVITWSWWWVLSPLWGGLTLVFIILLFVGIVAFFKILTFKQEI